MRDYVVNLNMQFLEVANDVTGRMEAAAAQGFRHVEFWRWQELDLDALVATVARTGVTVETFVVDWSAHLTDPRVHGDYLASWEQALRLAERVGTPQLILPLGDVNAALDEAAHVEVLSAFLTRLVPQANGAGVTLLIEPVNTRIDHPGTWLDSTARAFRLIDAVDAPALKLLLDTYHLAVSGEDLTAILRARPGDIGYVQLADAPGHAEPGRGTLDWPLVCRLLSEAGLTSRVALEYAPQGCSPASLRRATAFLDQYW
jgi:hydroxypyruvate isomerase